MKTYLNDSDVTISIFYQIEDATREVLVPPRCLLSFDDVADNGAEMVQECRDMAEIPQLGEELQKHERRKRNR